MADEMLTSLIFNKECPSECKHAICSVQNCWKVRARTYVREVESRKSEQIVHSFW